MRTRRKPRNDWFDWNTDDWDSVDWSTYWSQQISGRAGRPPRREPALEVVVRGSRGADPLNQSWDAESIGDAIDRLSREVGLDSFDESLNPFSRPALDLSPRAEMAPDVRELWCEPGKHHWLRPAIQGRRPTACPIHDTEADVPHPASDPSCFQLDDGWSLRLEVSRRLRLSFELDIPEALAAAIGVAPQQLIELRSASGHGPMLKLWRGRRAAWCRGSFGELVPPDARLGDRLFVAFTPPHYRVLLSHIDAALGPIGRVAALVGLQPASVTGDAFWHDVARRLGVSLGQPRELADVARARSDPELEDAIREAVRIIRPSSGWTGAWDLTARLHPDERFLALSDGRRCRVAVGIADSRDRLPEEYVVTPGGLVWMEVDEPEEARRARAELAPDVLTPALSDRWVTWMRLEHSVRRISLAGHRWRILVRGADGWMLDDGRVIDDLTAALEEVADHEIAAIPEGAHHRHIVPRSVMAVDRASRAARRSTLEVLESDTRGGFASRWGTGLLHASSLLGVLLQG